MCSYMVRWEGFEPSTIGLNIRPSTLSTATKTIPGRVPVQVEAFIFNVQSLSDVPLR